MVVSLTKSCPRRRGKWTRSGRKGNGSEQPSYFTSPPHSAPPPAPPPAGESFWVSIIKFLLAYRIEFAYNKDRKPRPPETVGRDIWLKESNRYLSPERLLFFLLIFITKRNTLKKNLKSSMSIVKNPKNSDHVIMKPPPFLIRIWVWPTVPFSASGQALKLSIM